MNNNSALDICIGIDLGTTNSCVAVWKDGRVHVICNDLGFNTTPSIVHYAEKQVLTGHVAKSKLNKFPKSTFYGVKRLLGQQYQHCWGQEFNYDIVADSNNFPTIKLSEEKTLRPEEISAHVLIKMRKIAENYLGHDVKKAVITVPAYFNDSQRSATKVAARIAGLEVLRMINEPTAACLCYGLDKIESCSNVLVYDLGGGTLDVSLLSLNNGLFEVLATSGDCNLGGDDFDLTLMNYWIYTHSLDLNYNQKNRLKMACEDLKKQLSQSDTAEYLLENFTSDGDLHLELEISKWNEICDDLIKASLKPIYKVLTDSEISEDEIDQIVLVGGSTRIRTIQDQLVKLFKGKQLNKSINPDEAVAYGAAIQAAIVNNQDSSGKTDQMVLVDVIPISLGIETTGGIMSVVVPRNTTIPCEKFAYYSTVENNQVDVKIRILQGERSLADECRLLGTFTLGNIPKCVRGIPKIKVLFKIDADGILNVTAFEEIGQIQQTVTISADSGRLSEQAIKQIIDEAELNFKADEIKRSIIENAKKILSTIKDFERMINDQNKTINSDLQILIFSTLLDFKQRVALATTVKAIADLEIEMRENVIPMMNQLYVTKIDEQPVTSNVIDFGELNQYLSELTI